MTQRRIYQSEYPYSVTFRTCSGISHFERTECAALLSRIMFRTGERKGYDILAYQIMPDHVHLAVLQRPPARLSAGALGSRLTGTMYPIASIPKHPSAATESRARGENISQFMYTLKSYFVHRMRESFNVTDPIWQKRFYAKIINTTEYLEATIRYFKQNPIKKSLPNKYHQMPFQFFDLERIRTLC